MLYRHILVPLIQHHGDSDRFAKSASILRGVSLASLNNCKLSIIAFEEKPAENPDWGLPRQQLMNLRTTYWQEVLNDCQAYAKQQGVEADTDIVWGRPVAGIIASIVNRHIDLIVKTSHRWQFLGIHRLPAGDMNLLHQSSVPVWLIPSNTETSLNIQKLAVAIDPQISCTSLNQLLLSTAKELLCQSHASLTVIHCWQIQGEDYYRRHLSPHQLSEAGKKIAASQRKHIREELIKSGLDSYEQVNIELVKERASVGICELIRNNPVDLLIMGTHNRSRLDRWILGSTAEHVLSYTPCPVLTLRLPGL